MADARYLDGGDFDAVIFDKDGTLLDFQQTWGRVVERVVRALTESDAQAAEVADVLGFDLESYQFAADSVLIAESNDVVAARIASVAPSVDIAALEAQVAIASQGSAAPRDGADALLRALAAGRIPVALATNDSSATARRQLEELGWNEQFVAVVGYDSGFGAKPAPAMVTAALEATGAVPHRAAMVGDSSHDLDAGRAAGLVTVYVGSDRLLSESADISVDHLASLARYATGL